MGTVAKRGSGYGDGYGDGSGDGSGYGYGYGYAKEYWSEIAHGVAVNLSPDISERAEAAKSAGAVLAFWKSDVRGYPCNNGSGTPAYPGKVDEEKGPLRLCERGTLHATYEPSKWTGSRVWVVAMYPPIEQEGLKIGSLKREIIGEVPSDEALTLLSGKV